MLKLRDLTLIGPAAGPGLGVLNPAAGDAMSQSSTDIDNVKAANFAFYDALSKRDMGAMQQVWAQTPDIILIAPPVRPVAHLGWEAIKKQFDEYWPTFEQLDVSMEPEAIRINGGVAWVYGVEMAQRRTKTGQTSSSFNVGTNIFVNELGRWLLAFHQSSAIAI